MPFTDHRDKSGQHITTSTATSKDLCKAFDKRFKNFTFHSIPPKLDVWKGSGIANQVFDEEYNIKHFKSSQEQLTWRLETWIDKCRIHEVDENGVMVKSSSGKFHSAKRFRKTTSSGDGGGGGLNNALTKVRSLSSASFSLGRVFSKSIENLYKHHHNVSYEENSIMNALPPDDNDEFQYASEIRANARIAPSKSTGDLLKTDFDDDQYFYENNENTSLRRDSKQEKQFNGKEMRKPPLQNGGDQFVMTTNHRKQQTSSPKNRFNKLLGSVAGKLKPGGNNKQTTSSASNNNKKKNRNSMDADFFFRQNSKNSSENNNNNIDKTEKRSRKTFRPSVLDFVRSINNKEHRHSSEHEKKQQHRSHAVARSTSVVARKTPSPSFEYQQTSPQQQQTLFKTRCHNDSVKRIKTRSVGTRPNSAGPFTRNQVFFDPKNDHYGESPSVRKDIGDV